MRERDHLEDPAIDWRLLLKCVFNKLDGKYGLDSYGLQSCRERGLNPGEKNYFVPTSKGGPAKNLYTKSERQTQLQSDLGLV